MTESAARLTDPDVRAAVEVIARRFNLHPDIYDNEYDYTNGCTCAGTSLEDVEDDGYDNPDARCNCADNCYCDGCIHGRHAQTRVCSVRDPQQGACTEPSRYKVSVWHQHRGGVSRYADDDDPRRNEHGSVELGDHRQPGSHWFACGTRHAGDLVDADREYRATFDAASVLSRANTYYDVDSYTYQPDGIDVPGPLHLVAENSATTSRWCQQAINATYATNPTGQQFAMEAAEQSIVRTLVRMLGARDHAESVRETS